MRFDDLHLWYLGEPATPRYVGTLKLVSAGFFTNAQHPALSSATRVRHSEVWLPLVLTQSRRYRSMRISKSIACKTCNGLAVLSV